MTNRDTGFLDIPLTIKDDEDTVRKGENDGTYSGLAVGNGMDCTV